ncbi:molybdopterin molybdotransferase MoeA [Streptomonospora nanhaiensis]|uniref:Molybdopterin molybdenumtransferase n=1 Tax=Streptomonospora nanhaiensis TaxID=1323731 RepID=A0A853BWW2_9ACTN|nr:molybdopterin molybdotransferase MoeA [Streptomonospora nanhaiensis]MBV2364683.1 molybdopterin molybdotransferase MoeA [Streptomonospora nanhaiensis]NYI99245.1 molybdopterin molybdotransferase [Streptomonospora nanhaiensis]
MVRCGNAVTPWAEAREAARELGDRLWPVAGRPVPLDRAVGAVLAQDLTALVGVPPFDAAAMDGYAVAGPGPEWTVVGRVLAGEEPGGPGPRGGGPSGDAVGAGAASLRRTGGGALDGSGRLHGATGESPADRAPAPAPDPAPASAAAAGPAPERGFPAEPLALRPGEAVEIATGAPVPPGADSVLPYELATLDTTAHGSVTKVTRVTGEIAPGRHVRRAGEDTAPGATVLPAGSTVTPAVVGLAAGLGHDTLTVRRPRVAALVTGDEIAAAGRPGAGQVRDAIGPVLPSLTASAGAEVTALRYIGDGFDTMVEALNAAAAPVDVVVVCGASSKGPADHLRAALTRIGATVVVDGVSCRPGHPQLLAHLGTPEDPGTVVVGLPGNPNAALAAAVTLLAPLLRAMAGAPDPGAALPPTARVKGAIRPHAHDTRLVAVRVTGGQAEPVGHDRPGSLRGAALADAYAVIPPGWSGPYAALVWLPRGGG